jgi:protein phosphatase
LVVDTLADYWQKVKSDKPPTFLGPIEKDISRGAKHLINSILLANIMIHEAQKRPEYHRMGSTISALLVEKDCMWAANVGDSSIYHFDHGLLTQVSEEHSLEAERKSMGLIDPLDSTSPLLKNMLTRVLGQGETVDVYITSIAPDAGNLVMLCSDGLTGYLSEPAISIILDDFSLSIDRKVDILISEANQGGGGDNISAILLEVMEEGKWRKWKKRFKRK